MKTAFSMGNGTIAVGLVWFDFNTSSIYEALPCPVSSYSSMNSIFDITHKLHLEKEKIVAEQKNESDRGRTMADYDNVGNVQY